MNGADIFDIDRRAVDDFERNVLDVGDAFDVAASAHVILGRADLENFSAHIAVGHADFVHDVAERNAVGDEFVRIEIDLVLLDEAADRRDFGHAFDRFERVTQMPVLERAQVRRGCVCRFHPRARIRKPSPRRWRPGR